MKKPFTFLLLLLTVSLSVGPLPFGVSAQQTGAAQTAAQTLRLAGLRQSVTVRRDERGIPYIEAQNEADLYFAQGYVTASDRLWQMELGRRFARGELSEILGSEALEEDKRHRAYGFAQVAEAEAAQAPSEARAQLESYAQGVNAYLATLDEKSLPPEFRLLQFRPRLWTIADSLLVIKNFAEALNTSWPADITMEAGRRALPADKRDVLLLETSPLDVLVVGTDNVRKKAATSQSPADSFSRTKPLEAMDHIARIERNMARSFERLGIFAEDRAASNNWVVSGKHTMSGKPLLANDPHLGASAPSIWYMTHLSAPGVRVAGVTSPGLPGIVIGHNERIAWGFTNVGPDVQDLYVEKFDTENPRRYMTPAGWRESEVRREVIKVRKSLIGSAIDVVPFDVTVTRHGPIVLERDGKRYALRWTALDPKLNDAAGFQTLNRARNWKEFVSALSGYTGPMQNMVYADVDGHIGYYAAGRVPIRRGGDGSIPYDGATDDGEWTGFIPFDKLPQLYDPPSGIIVTANQRIVGQDYPYFLTHVWPAPYRARRILNLLQAKPKLTIDDFRAIQGDTYSIAGATFAREVVKLGRAQSPTEGKWRETIQLLEGWDGRMNADSRAALMVAVLRTEFSNRIFEAALGAELAKNYSWPNRETLVDMIITEQPREWLPKEFKDYAELLRAAEASARVALTKRFGADESKRTWGQQAQVRFPHPLTVVPLVGQQFLIQPFPQNGSGGNTVSVNVGRNVSMRLIADPSDWDKTEHGITLGQSGLPTSPHWKDQLEDWRNVTPRAFPFTRTAVTRATQETILLEPAAK